VKIGDRFRTPTGVWRVTDVGTRTIAAIRVDQVTTATGDGQHVTVRKLDEATAEAEGWFRGPPYAVVEYLFDEDDQGEIEILP
jgi:hypothetical protein